MGFDTKWCCLKSCEKTWPAVRRLWRDKILPNRNMYPLKTVYTLVIVNDQYSHLVYLNICIKPQTCETLGSISSKLQEKKREKKHPVCTTLCAFSRRKIKGSSWSRLIFWVRHYLFLKDYVTSEGAVSQNVLCYKQLPIACYKVSFYAINYFE